MLLFSGNGVGVMVGVGVRDGVRVNVGVSVGVGVQSTSPVWLHTSGGHAI